ncbi:Uu.00g044330.m01.CDS01 [Anthostomella pinea]|uniref:ATP-dependent DNA helicase n=1 Tax=Anthostomella pinea TaxID=933095 RepID=A0AAI8VBW4_9PEZI|nr:Uu.00g044330.m01.CDS01 [Anthostomella pinea]
MDSDEFDDDIADEDLIIAATQVQTSNRVQSAKLNNGRFQPHVQHTPAQIRQTTSAVRKTSSNLNGSSSFVDLADLPSNAFSSSPASAALSGQARRGFRPAPPVGGPATSYRQTTLFGQTALARQEPESTQPNKNRVFRADLPPEAPTHHDVDLEAMKTWVYPTNLGPTRDYQYSIVKNGLFNNTLVALPTGLGKTFIAATVMLNYFRWMKTAKIIFVAPTKPLVSQQVDACFHIAGMPRSQTTLLTGEIPPALRAEEWESKRVFFMTPQTLENDLSSGFADPKSVGLLVVDEAHRATGNYSYVKVVTFLRRFSTSLRILALTATPGSKVEAVQEVIDNLGISHVEIRTEESIDIRQYVHQRDEDIVVLDPSDEMNYIKEMFSKALKPLVDKLSQQNIYFGRDPMSLTTYGLVKARQDWNSRGGHSANQGVKFMMMAVFAVLGSLAHSIKLLNFHGIRPFYDNLVQFRDETEGKGEKGSKYKRQIVEAPSFQEMMTKIAAWSKKDNFVSHPKITCLSDTVLNHFMDAGEGREGGSSSNTRIIVFSEYRDSAEDIVRTLNTHKPMIRAAVFVGQADSTRSAGMKQAEQIERIKKFKNGDYNVLVATSIGEEGLDIGQVDLIICYDASASPIRMLQRMGRTGRKRAGRVVLLLMRGKEEDNYSKSKDGYEKMQVMICDGSRFNFRHDLSTRIVPRDVRPEVDMRPVDIPIENTQVSGLPEPKKSRARKKKPAKKFNMPDGVETGFTSVAAMMGKHPARKTKTPKAPVEEDEVAAIPGLDQVLLLDQQRAELNRSYKSSPNHHQDEMELIEQVDLTAHPAAQRKRQKTVDLKHGAYTKRCAKLIQTLAKSQSAADRFTRPYQDLDRDRYKELPLPVEGSETEAEAPGTGPPRKKRKTASFSDPEEVDDDDEPEDLYAVLCRARPAKKAPVRKKQATTRTSVLQDVDEDEEGRALPPPARKRATAPKTKKTVPKAAGPKRARGRPKKNKSTGVYDESADEGDDCRRTSDLELTDEDDDGADLVDFVVGDDVATSSNFVTSSIQGRSTSPTSPSTPSTITHHSSAKTGEKPPKPKPYYEPMSFPDTQDDDDDDDIDMPSMSQLVRNNGPSRNTAAGTSKIGSRDVFDIEDEDEEDGGDDDDDDDDDDDGPLQRGRGRLKKNRRVVLDDDEDEDG